MVFVVHKKNESDQFMIETSCSTQNDELISLLSQLNNQRVSISIIAEEIEKILDENGGKNEEEKEEMEGNEKETKRYQGISLSQQQRISLERIINDSRIFISKKQVDEKIALTLSMNEQQLQSMKQGLASIFPQGLKDSSVFDLAFEGKAKELSPKECYDPATATLWWAGKELERGQTLGKYIGKNEKTKIIAKLQRATAQGPPAKDESEYTEQQKEMMSFYYKRAQEQKKLEEDNEDSYVNSAWANPKNLKNTFNGLENISWKHQ
eukprot:TRINITY_DN8523_c0_g1_i1.p1 TRINITY_DN8523_c0_g1~~TRINITY_DN8523_c0_g1_i1.p1  ORF type:complete len:282 (-),score=119.00 TRINITY_DN8523_c0_g1_i1:161-958(-)